MTLFCFCCSSPSSHFSLHLFQLPFFFFQFFLSFFFCFFFTCYMFFSTSLVCRRFYVVAFCFLLSAWFVTVFLFACIVIISVSYLDVVAIAVCFLLYFSQLLIDLKFLLLFVCVYGLLYLFQFKCIYGRKYILNVLLLHNKHILEELSRAICCITFI